MLLSSSMSITPRLKFFDLTMIVVSFVIGIGIFRTPAIVAAKAGTPFIFFTAWIMGGVISTCGALTFAEIGSRYPAAGGFYRIFSYCYHPAYAFMLNWSLVIINAASGVGVALVGAEYIVPVVCKPEWQTQSVTNGIAVAVVLLLFGLNFLGIKAGARVQNVLSLLKIAMVLLFCLAVFAGHNTATAVSTFAAPDTGGFIKALGVSLISVFFTYGGYQNTMNLGADIENPAKNIPRSIFGGMAIVIVLYLAINFAYYAVIGFGNLQHSTLPAADLAGAVLGTTGRALTSVVIFISVLGFINTSLMSNPRIYYAMAEDRVLPGIFKRVNSRTMAQEFALAFFTALMIGSLFLLKSFDRIVNYVEFIDCLSLVSAAGTIFILRYRAQKSGTEPANIYRIRLYPFVPIVFMLVLLAVAVSVFISDTSSALYGIAIFIAGLPLYALMRTLLKGE